MSRFTTDVYQNEFLPIGGSEVNAVVTITSGEDGVSDGIGVSGTLQTSSAVIVIVDVSGSMSVPRAKIKAARHATAVAIDAIPDGVPFAVIAGAHEATPVYPTDGTLATALGATREHAKALVSRLKANGGTAIGSWLDLARSLFESVPGHVCQAILLTDGENTHESAEELEAVLATCEGRFQCDCRGVGTDWQVSELRRIASVLLGSVDIIADPADMSHDFQSMMESAMARCTGRVALRVWTPQGAHVTLLRQVAPTIEDLTSRGMAVSPLASDYPTGAWGQESRDYHLCISVPPRGIGDEMLAARVSLVEDDVVVGQGLVKAIWTADEALSTRISREVAHYTGQAELAECIQTGLEARKAGDVGTATFKLGRAVQLATQSGNDGTLKLLEAVVEVDDAATGTIRLRRQVADADEMALDTRSTKTVRVGPSA